MSSILTEETKTTLTSQYFEIKPLAGRIGAQLVGVDLSDALNDNTISDIRKALIQYKVIFFRGQNLDANGQVAFARRFGELTTAHPSVASLEGHPEVLDIDYGKGAHANNWHTDVSFVDRPPLGSVLRALVIPPVGGDTIWANCVSAYQDLPEHLRTLANQLWAIHSNAYEYQAVVTDSSQERQAFEAEFTSTVYEALHPVVRVHPESGERSLYIGGFVRRIRGLSQTESDDLVRLLKVYITRPENTVRWRWQEGDVAFWDNRATEHYAISDYGDRPRHVQRVTITGDIPVSIDGKHSQAIKGDSSRYHTR